MSETVTTTMRRSHPQQMEAWVAKLQLNMRLFLESNTTDPVKQLAFIQQQYALLDIVTKVLSGTMYFTGCSHPVIGK